MWTKVSGVWHEFGGGRGNIGFNLYEFHGQFLVDFMIIKLVHNKLSTKDFFSLKEDLNN